MAQVPANMPPVPAGQATDLDVYHSEEALHLRKARGKGRGARRESRGLWGPPIGGQPCCSPLLPAGYVTVAERAERGRDSITVFETTASGR
jgi:hypothetical protein